MSNPLFIACPTCEVGVGEACVDTGMGSGQWFSLTVHPRRIEAAHPPLTVPCPFCGSQVGEHCRDSRGYHPLRISASHPDAIQQRVAESFRQRDVAWWLAAEYQRERDAARAELATVKETIAKLLVMVGGLKTAAHEERAATEIFLLMVGREAQDGIGIEGTWPPEVLAMVRRVLRSVAQRVRQGDHRFGRAPKPPENDPPKTTPGA